jgi:hypothetical protein
MEAGRIGILHEKKKNRISFCSPPLSAKQSWGTQAVSVHPQVVVSVTDQRPRNCSASTTEGPDIRFHCIFRRIENTVL